MRTAEEYIRFRHSVYDPIQDIIDGMSCDEIIEIIEQAQTEAYNQAIDDAAENASTTLYNEITEVDEQSILKLKK